MIATAARVADGARISLRRVLQYIKGYNVSLPLPAGQYCSELDRACGESALGAVEQMFADERMLAIRDAFVAFLGDPEAERSLKKGMHEVYERALRAIGLRYAPPQNEGFDAVPVPRTPYEAMAFRDLQSRGIGLDVLPQNVSHGAPSSLRLLIPIFGWASAVVVKAAAIYVMYGRTGVEPRRFRIATQDFWTERRWRPILAALGWEFPAARDFVIIRERPGESDHLASSGFAMFDPATAKVPRSAWLREVIGPSFVLAGRMIWAAVRAPYDPRVLLGAAEALHQAYLSLNLHRTIYNLRFDLCLDIVEYNAFHNLKGIVYRRIGGGVARLPYSDVDAFSAATAYLGYDLYLGSGHYAQRYFADSWSPSCRFVATGQMYANRLRRDDAMVVPDVRHAIEAHLQAGRRLIAYFGGSKVPGVGRVQRDILAALWREIQGRDDCVLIIKPKLSNDLYELLEEDDRLRAMLCSPKVLCLRYGPLKDEICPSVWLLERIVLGTTMPGSVQTEGLLAGRVVLSYYPVAQRNRPLPRILAEAGIRHSDLASFIGAVRGCLDGRFPAIPTEFLADWFDPFGDDAALARIATALMSVRPHTEKVA